MVEIHGIIESVSIVENEGQELWSFIIKDENGVELSVDSFTRHFPDPIISGKSFTAVSFINENTKELVEVKVPRNEVPASISDIKIFEGKSVVFKRLNNSL